MTKHLSVQLKTEPWMYYVCDDDECTSLYVSVNLHSNECVFPVVFVFNTVDRTTTAIGVLRWNRPRGRSGRRKERKEISAKRENLNNDGWWWHDIDRAYSLRKCPRRSDSPPVHLAISPTISPFVKSTEALDKWSCPNQYDWMRAKLYNLFFSASRTWTELPHHFRHNGSVFGLPFESLLQLRYAQIQNFHVWKVNDNEKYPIKLLCTLSPDRMDA